MARAFTEIAFTPTVRALQEEGGSAAGYAAGFMGPDADRADRLTPEDAAFVEARDGFYQASVAGNGWPYVQFRGGPAGFLRVLDDKTLGYADFRGNRQYLSAGNISEDPRIALILMDYPNRRRLKIWGRAALVRAADDPDLVARLAPEGYRARIERAVLIHVEALDWNCPQHIPRRLTEEEWRHVSATAIDALARQVHALQRENADLRARLDDAAAMAAGPATPA